MGGGKEVAKWDNYKK